VPTPSINERVKIPVGRARSNARARMRLDHGHHLPEYIAYLLDRVQLAHDVMRANRKLDAKHFGKPVR
jgi:hypothetical protein